jgi:hypothetical protein
MVIYYYKIMCTKKMRSKSVKAMPNVDRTEQRQGLRCVMAAGGVQSAQICSFGFYCMPFQIWFVVKHCSRHTVIYFYEQIRAYHHWPLFIPALFPCLCLPDDKLTDLWQLLVPCS